MHNGQVSDHEDGNRHVELNDGISVTESAFVSKATDDGETVGFVVSRGGDDPRAASTDLNDQGRLVSTNEGMASDKKKSELRTAQLFVQHLNSAGQQWSDVTAPPDGLPEEGVDAIAAGINGRMLKIQVTTPETAAWRQLARRTDPWRSEEEVRAAVDAVNAAIQRKHLKAHPDIHLVLDATDSPRFALTAVVTEFRKQYGTSARGRFAQVWIVGPVVDSVERLDV